MRKENLLLIFMKNPIPGKVKTRLAQDLGNEKAVEFYKKLLAITKEATDTCDADKWLCYGDFINHEDDWSPIEYHKKLQQGDDLGQRISSFFNKGFDEGYKNIVIIGSDCPELVTWDLDNAFALLDEKDAVIGPANDGGYYLLGLSKNVNLFSNKSWSTESVYSDTIQEMQSLNLSFEELEEKIDLDTVEDLKNFPNL